MAGGIWDRVKAGLGLSGAQEVSPADNHLVRKIADHFGLLANDSRGLPDEIAKFVATGAPSGVMHKLQAAGLRGVWAKRALSNPPRDESGLFTAMADWRIDQMVRMGEVLAALEPIAFGWRFCGSTTSPDWLRHIVTLWLGNRHKEHSVETLIALAEGGGVGIASVLDVMFCRDVGASGSKTSLSRFGDIACLFSRERDAVLAVLANSSADVCAEFVATVGRFGLQSDYLPTLLDAATGRSKKVRLAARQALTGSDRQALATMVQDRFATAEVDQRAELVEVAAACLGDDAAAVLAGMRADETNAKVLAAFDRIAGSTAASARLRNDAPGRPDTAEGYTAVDGSWVAIAPLADGSAFAPLDRDALALLDPAIKAFNAKLAAAQQGAAWAKWHWSHEVSPVDHGAAEALKSVADGALDRRTAPTSLGWLHSHLADHPAIDRFFDDPRVSLHHLLRIALATTNFHYIPMMNDSRGPADAAIRRRLALGLDMRALMDVWMAIAGNDFVTGHLSRDWHTQLRNLEVPIWPLVAKHFAQLDEALGLVPQSGVSRMLVIPAMELLALLPKLPERYRGRLLILANDSSRHIREPARALLRETTGIAAAIALQLDDGNQDVRALAAIWLANRGERDQIGAIRRALRSERSDRARAAMITALQRLGADVSEYFDHTAMVKEAKAGIARFKSSALDWFVFDHLPRLRWSDGTPVDPLLPRWWVMLACKLKQPGGNALIDLWLDRLMPGDAHRLGWMVLTGWIDQDVRTSTDEDANAFAAAKVDGIVAQNIDTARRWPGSVEHDLIDRAVVFARLKAQQAGTYLGDAADSKGVLALASRVNAADAVVRVRAYLKAHAGRVAQVKALLDMMAATGSSVALQVVLNAASRSKQRAVEAHAAALIEHVAERNGWTAAQLADRTVPTGGFDADGTLELDCGEGRVYTARLDASDEIAIYNADGREVKALPGPRRDDERPAVEAAKKLLSNARKELKQVRQAQRDRLQEAMCLQRSWPRDDWENFIVGHPIIGRMASHLVWQGLDAEGQALAMFRPLGDGSHTDTADNAVDTSRFAAIRLAHSSALDAAAIAAWRAHLADYAVTPVFDQLERDLPRLPEAMAHARTIKDREGWMIETFKLRDAATQHGYLAGKAQHGGWFMTYEKIFREAGLLAEITFTGSPLPEQNRPAALESLSFRKARGSGGPLALGSVPPVLLAECWQDFHDIAAKGTGFDADWSKKASA